MADFRIIADSSCELPEQYSEKDCFQIVPFRMEIDGLPIRDDKKINIMQLLEKIANSKTCPRSACPSPDMFMRHMEGDEERVYIITISSKLSGCYNSALLAKRIYEEENSDKKIAVIDSRSASGGESLIALKAYELEEQGLPFEQIVEELEAYRDSLYTYVVLDNLETLRKNGRLSRLKAAAASSLHIKPLLEGVMGELVEVEKAIGLRKAWNCMVKRIAKEAALDKMTNTKRIVITHCNNLAGAEKVRDMLKSCTDFKEYIIMNTSGLSSLYANDGGIIIAY